MTTVPPASTLIAFGLFFTLCVASIPTSRLIKSKKNNVHFYRHRFNGAHIWSTARTNKRQSLFSSRLFISGDRALRLPHTLLAKHRTKFYFSFEVSARSVRHECRAARRTLCTVTRAKHSFFHISHSFYARTIKMLP